MKKRKRYDKPIKRPKPANAAMRPCLGSKCRHKSRDERMFASSWPGERICPRCRQANREALEGGRDDLVQWAPEIEQGDYKAFLAAKAPPAMSPMRRAAGNA